jgi:hypothetical protein
MSRKNRILIVGAGCAGAMNDPDVAEAWRAGTPRFLFSEAACV